MHIHIHCWAVNLVPSDLHQWNHHVKHLASQNFLKHHIPLSAPKSSASDTTLSHIFSQQCKPKQLKRYKSFIDKWLNVLKKLDLPNNETDLLHLKLRGAGPFTFKHFIEPLVSYNLFMFSAIVLNNTFMKYIAILSF